MELPWPWPAFRTRSPGATRWRVALHLRRVEAAGYTGPLLWSDGVYSAPGFRMAQDGARYLASVETPIACMGALAAALVDQGSEETFTLVHGALISFGACGALVLGQSGAGKSTLAQRLGRRVLGSNAALVWQHQGSIWASPLPITGHGDAAIAARSVRLVGAWILGSDPPASTLASGVACWLSALASARGKPPAVEWAWRLAQTTPLRPLYALPAPPPLPVRERGLGG